MPHEPNEGPVVVSDHALVRYLERVVGLDFTTNREEILSAQLAESIMVCGDGRYPIGNGFTAIVKNKTVITVVGDCDAL